MYKSKLKCIRSNYTFGKVFAAYNNGLRAVIHTEPLKSCQGKKNLPV